MSKKFIAFWLVCLLLPTIISGGCGGGSSSPLNNDNNNNDDNSNGNPPESVTQRSILVGSLDGASFGSSDLTPYIKKRLTEVVDVFASENTDWFEVASVIEDAKSGDIIFIGNKSSTDDDNITDNDALELAASIYKAYQNGAAIVAVYPDSEDVDVLNKWLQLDINPPYEDAPYPFFELVAAAQRPMPNEDHHVFTYVADCAANEAYFAGLIESNVDEYLYEDTEDEETEDDFDFDSYTDDTEALDEAELFRELCEHRVQKLYDWEAGLNERAKVMGAEISAAVSQLAQTAGLKDELLSVSTGMTTDNDDNFSSSFVDYYNVNIKTNSAFSKFASSLGLDRENVLKAYNAIKVNRNTNSHYQVVSVHSFESHRDYYLVRARTNTQPITEVRSKYGTHTGDEICGKPSVLGYTDSLLTYVWPNIGNNHLERYEPSQTVNKNTSYTSSNGWSTTDAVSMNGKVGVNDKGLSAELGFGYTYSDTLNHNSSMSWSTSDYEIIPSPYTWQRDGSRIAMWEVKVTQPKLKDDAWQISTAAKDSLTLDTESIFWVDMNEADKFSLYGQAKWRVGFESVPQHIGIIHQGASTKLNMRKPPHMALSNPVYTGSKDAMLYTTTLHSEGNWTATSDADWLDLIPKSGNAGSITVRYEAQENTTGKMRVGTITFTSGQDKVFLEFTQSGGGVYR